LLAGHSGNVAGSVASGDSDGMIGLVIFYHVFICEGERRLDPLEPDVFGAWRYAEAQGGIRRRIEVERP
jgi:hypothetical protein